MQSGRAGSISFKTKNARDGTKEIHNLCGHPDALLPIVMYIDVELIEGHPFDPFKNGIPDDDDLTRLGVPLQDGAQAQYEWLADRGARHLMGLLNLHSPCHATVQDWRARLRLAAGSRAAHPTQAMPSTDAGNGHFDQRKDLSSPSATKSGTKVSDGAVSEPRRAQRGHTREGSA